MAAVGRGWFSNIVGSVSLTTTQTVAEVAHGLGSAPAFVLATSIGVAAPSNHVSAVVTDTTVTLATGNTTQSKTIAYMIAKSA